MTEDIVEQLRECVRSYVFGTARKHDCVVYMDAAADEIERLRRTIELQAVQLASREEIIEGFRNDQRQVSAAASST